MTAPILADALGPRGRRQARIASVVAVVVIGAAVIVAVVRLNEKGQFDAALWNRSPSGGSCGSSWSASSTP